MPLTCILNQHILITIPLTFQDFNLEDSLIEGLDAMNFQKPTPIQEQAIPIIMEGKDIIACAQTGTGKTAAFILPIIHKIIKEQTQGSLNTLVIAPTRELAQQIDQQIEGLGYFTGVSSIPVYGGGDGFAWEQQRKAMEQGADVIIATPGRLIALLSAGTIKLDKLKYLVLDEADRMLDMGFYDDIVRIINYLPADRQTLLFSATMPPKIRTLANKILRDPVSVSVAISKPAEGINQMAFYVFDEQKVKLIESILEDESYSSVVIFAGTKESVKKLESTLQRKDMSVKGFQSDLEQSEREEIMRAFKNKKIRILVGTDILSRGIDVEGISLVINFDVPGDAEDYIHRIGRTARAETTGTAITFVNTKDYRKLQSIERLLGKEIRKVNLPKELGEGPDMNNIPRQRPESSGRKPFRKKQFNRKKNN
jgi:ATP-dependent RNA helicase RhlE